MTTCKADYKVYGQGCGKPATTSRPTWRFGDESKGESTIVDIQYHLCAECAELWDEMQAEGEAEARAS